MQHQEIQNRIGVLVAQLGTPDEPTARALRPYLKQFLSDRRVIDYSPLLWQPLLRGIILNTRPPKSAEKYQRIWLEEGSPLLIYSERQVEGLQQRLGDDYCVKLGMTYGNPSIQSAIDAFRADGIHRILVFSMFPQYSSTTTASIYDSVYQAAAGRAGVLTSRHQRFIPTLRFVVPYYADSGYIQAIVSRIQQTRQQWGQTPEKYIFSFHGIPARYVSTGDPYPHQCQQTAQLLAKALGLSDDQWILSFQSQFGPEKWLTPYTEEVLESLPHQGCKSVLVVCAGFTADCLETLDELGNEGREQFEKGGGSKENFLLIPCLNDDPSWLDTMTDIARRETSGWL